MRSNTVAVGVNDEAGVLVAAIVFSKVAVGWIGNVATRLDTGTLMGALVGSASPVRAMAVSISPADGDWEQALMIRTRDNQKPRSWCVLFDIVYLHILQRFCCILAQFYHRRYGIGRRPRSGDVIGGAMGELNLDDEFVIEAGGSLSEDKFQTSGEGSVLLRWKRKLS